MLRMKLPELAKRAAVAEGTIRRLESGKSEAFRSTVVAVQCALEDAGAEFAADGWVRVSEGHEYYDERDQ